MLAETRDGRILVGTVDDDRYTISEILLGPHLPKRRAVRR